MSLPDFRTTVNVLPLVLLNYILMGFVQGEQIYECSICHFEPEALVPQPQIPLPEPCSMSLFIHLSH